MFSMLRTAGIVVLVSVAVSSAPGRRIEAQATLPWMNTSLTPEQRADLLIPRLTLEQKVAQISNDTRPAEDPANRPPGCEFQPIGRHIQAIPELGIPTVRMVNGGTGIRGGDCLPEPRATGVPSTPALAATFNLELSRQLGDILGDEARRHGHQVMLAPGMNLHRHPWGGRNYEYQSEDPYLSGVMAVEQIKGIQAHGIHANAKHFAANEQEAQRRQMATVVPPRALHELYLLPFEMAVRDADPASIMCAFPEINGISACSNAELLTTTLRERWGFKGYVMTDRRAVHDLAPSIKAGVDWELSHITPLHYSLEPQPGQRGNPGSEGIRAALAGGSITVSDIDQMLRRRYIQMFKYGHFETDFDALYEAEPDIIAHGLVAREIAEQSIVLLKNENNFLPLDAATINSVALIGAEWFAGDAKLPPRSIRGDNSNVVAPYRVTPEDGLKNVLRSLGSSATVAYDSAVGSRRNSAIELARNSDVVIVMVGDNPHELCDRETLGLPIIPGDTDFCGYDELEPGEYELPTPAREPGTDQEALMRELTAAPGVAQKMVVVLKTEGMILMPWLDQVPALVEAWYPGQEDGNAVANILFGLRNPSGKLPMTFGTSAREAAHATNAQFPGLWVDPPHWLNQQRFSAQYTEGLQVGYRWYEANGVRPVFPFGFGLSYTTFAYSGLSVANTIDEQTGRSVLTVTYTITNTGTSQGAEASQAYLTLPAAAEQPSKRLVGFRKIDLMPGASQQVTVTIDPSASNHPLSYWVPENNAPVPGWSRGTWATASGDYTVHVGTSSAETPLTLTFAFTAPTSPGTCTTVQPGPGWVCVNGGWLPPGYPGTTPNPTPNPGACTSVQPGPGWVCVNGNWLPPGYPGTTVTPNPAPNPGACPSVRPGPGWVCVNGNWLPPGYPGTVGGGPAPQLLLVDSAHVEGVRESLLQGGLQYKPALADLEEDAVRALRVAPVSVMDKPVTPPSGNKHDYMSQAPYWWPDPSKPNGLPYIPRDGRRNPEIDRITDRANLERVADAVSTLALALHFTGREAYGQHAARLVRVWFLDAATRMNPELRFAQGIPGITDGRSAGIIETRLLPIIVDGVILLQGSSAWSAADDTAFRNWMRDYLRWLVESPLAREQLARGNNQETWYDLQVAALAIYTGQTELAREAITGARAEIGRQFEPDGRQPRELERTRAWDYSIFNLTAFLHLAALGNRVDVDLWNHRTADERSLRQGVEYLIPFATGGSRFPYRQLGEFRRTALHPVLRRAAVGWNEPRYREIAHQIGGATRRLELTLP